MCRLDAVYDLLDDIDSPNFFLDIDVESTGAQPPGTRGLRRELKAWLAQIDPDAIASLEGGPQWRWSNGQGWTLVFRAIPKHGMRGKAGVRAVGVYDHGGVRVVDEKGPLLEALGVKGSRYGTLDAPYVVAVMDDGDHPPHASSTADALYGTAVADFDPATRTIVERPERAPDGYWRDRTGPRHSGVSAVITAWALSPWEVARRYPRIWHNPYATNPLVSPLPFPAARYRPTANDFDETAPTLAPHELFQLTPEWPSFPPRPWEETGGAQGGH
jgi:hypothetical protein